MEHLWAAFGQNRGRDPDPFRGPTQTPGPTNLEEGTLLDPQLAPNTNPYPNRFPVPFPWVLYHPVLAFQTPPSLITPRAASDYARA